MKIMQPSAHILPMSGSIFEHVERCGRIAYKSEDKITEGSYLRFIRNVIERGHESVLEHGNYIFKVEQSGYEWVRELCVMLNFAPYTKNGYSPRLRFTARDGRYIVSGNIRAWRDFIRVTREEGHAVPDWVENAFRGNPAFFDIKFDSQKPHAHEFQQIERPEELLQEELLAHWTETVHFVCSRAISHELVRHRALSPTQESQRYVNYAKGRFGGEVAFIQPEFFKGFRESLWKMKVKQSEEDYMMWIDMGYPPQEARESLPNSTKTELVMTGTLGEWLHFFDLREAPDAHSEMRRLAKPLHGEFREKYAV